MNEQLERKIQGQLKRDIEIIQYAVNIASSAPDKKFRGNHLWYWRGVLRGVKLKYADRVAEFGCFVE